MRVAKSLADLKRLNKFARRLTKQGLKADPIRYEGPNGRFNMVFNGYEYELELLDDLTCDWEEIHSVILPEELQKD